MENTVIKVLTKEHGKKVIEWFKLQGIDTNGYYGNVNEESGGTAIYYGVINGIFSNFFIKNVIENNAKIIELPTEEEFDLTTDEGRLAYAKKHYPIGTKYIPINNNGELVYRYSREIAESTYNPIWFRPSDNCRGIICGNGFIYGNGKWAEIINEVKEINMETQKLSRKGLKEIHSVACSNWKAVLEKYGANSPLEDYIELTQEQVDNMFKACTSSQLPIVSKYLKRDDGSVDLTTLHLRNNHLISIRQSGEHKHKAFELNTDYDWILNFDNEGELCLIPTKKQ